MTVISNIVEIRCTPEGESGYLSDHRSELEWNPGIESTGKLTDGPVGLGTRYLEIRPELGPPRLGRPPPQPRQLPKRQATQTSLLKAGVELARSRKDTILLPTN